VAALQRKLAAMHVNTSPFASVGGKVGGRIGSFFGNSGIGNDVGSWLGSGIGKIFGSGTYKMSKNSLWSTSDQCPVMHSNSESVIVRHREYIQDINSSVGFANTEFSLNPGLAGTFPFLSSIAANFQEFNFKGLVFEFKSTSADALNSTNTALGTIAMAIQYRAGAPSFTTKQQVLNEMWSADSKPADSFFMPVECSPAECPMDIQYVRTGALASNDDIKFYDLGRLSVASVGSQAASVVGELWASYEVALRKPILGGAIGVDVTSFIVFRSGVTATDPLGTNTALTCSSSMGVLLTSTTVTIPAGSPGKYILSIMWKGAAASAYVPPTVAYTTNLTGNTINGLQSPGQGTGASTDGCGVNSIFNLIDPSKPGVFTIGAAGTLAVPVFTYIWISQIDHDTVST
jgi:hypothetical protein